ncbi:MAG: ABC transporter substrate-binding protein [Thermoplasmata archaeon]
MLATLMLASLLPLATTQDQIEFPSITYWNGESYTFPHWYYGGWKDEVVFRVMYDESARMLALKAGEIDFIYSAYPIPADLIGELVGVPEARLVIADDAGFQHIALHSAMFPTDNVYFRRALAYALDKNSIVDIIWKFGTVTDTPIPPIFGPWSAEADVGGAFYSKNIPAAVAELALGGFVDVDGDGWVEYDPDGDGVGEDLNGDGTPNDDVEIEVLTPSTPMARARTGPKAAEDWRDAGIKAYATVTDFGTVISAAMAGSWEEPGDWNVALWGWGLGIIPDHMYDFTNTEGTWNQWVYHFSDPVNDEVTERIITAPTEEDAREAVVEAHTTFLDNMPFIPYLALQMVQGHRVDKFKGWNVRPGEAISSSWNLWNLRDIAGGFGGTVRTTLITAPSSTNVLASTDYYSNQYLDLIYDSLYNFDATLWAPSPLYPHLADWTTEVVFDASLGQDIYKITWSLVKDPPALFHDGTPITAEDVAFSYEIINFTMPALWGSVVETWINTTIIDDNTFIVYGDTPSFTEWFDLSGPPILPKHIWGDPATYGKETWEEVTPTDIFAFDPAENPELFVGSGGGMWKAEGYVPGELYVVEVDPNHFSSVRQWPEIFAPAVVGPTGEEIEEEEVVGEEPFVPGEIFEKDSFSPLAIGPTEWPGFYANNLTIAAGIGIVGLVIGVAVGLAVRRRE